MPTWVLPKLDYPRYMPETNWQMLARIIRRSLLTSKERSWLRCGDEMHPSTYPEWKEWDEETARQKKEYEERTGLDYYTEEPLKN